MPPGFKDHGVADTNFAAAAQSIALLGFFGVPVLYPMLSGARQTQILVGVGVALVALVLVFTFSQTSFSFEEGRWGSIIWTLSQIEERTFGLPISVYLLSAVGAFLLTWASMEGSFTLRIAVIGYSVYSATLALQSYAWQRYSEVFALFIVSFVAARVLPERHGFHTVVFVVFYLIWLSITFIVRAEV